METALNQRAETSNHQLPSWLLATFFWVFTYALFTYRAKLQYGDHAELLSLQRIGATLVGAGLYWLVVTNLIRATGSQPAKPLGVIATILPASIIVLAARHMLDLVVEDGITEFQRDMRWVLVWSGYFGLWISAALALHMSRMKHLQGSGLSTIAPSKVGTSVPTRPAIVTNASSVDWLLDEIAAAVIAMPAAEGRKILLRLEYKAGYEIADELDPLQAEQKSRSRLVSDLAERCRQR